MYYILNETDQIIAADTDLLELCGLTHIDQLNLNIALGKTKFDLASAEKLVIKEGDEDTAYPVSKISLSSLLGNLTLVDIQAAEEKSEDTEESIITPDQESELFSIESEEPEVEETTSVTEAAEKDTSLVDLDLDIAEKTAESIDETPSTPSEDTDILDLDLDISEKSVESADETLSEPNEDTDTLDLDLDIAEESVESAEEVSPAPSEDTDILDLDLDFAIKEEETPEAEPVSDDTGEILIDIAEVSQRIGVSEEDYDTFLNEYIDTAIGFEEDLKSSDAQKRSEAIGTLSHLSDLLQLPMMSDMIATINTAEGEKQKEIIQSFYSALSRITTSKGPEKEPEIENFVSEEVAAEESEPAVEKEEKGFGSISLEGIKPIHFDFQLEEAASDLSLPVDLIEEFVRDFIDQAHVETEKMLKAYEEGDLETIQKIGHLLKGASSNLRINPLSDTLYKIQFCEDVSNLENYIKDYWAHFLSFEIQINALAK
jgi:hypothetical protein